MGSLKGCVMLSHEVTNISFESFRELSAGKKVILLYPWANFRNIFLSYFLNDLDEGLLYYRISENMPALGEWVAGLLNELQQVLPDFGAELTAALAGGSAVALGAALAAELQQIDIERVVLFLDELDRVPQDDEFREFMTALVDSLPDNVQLAVSSRLLTRAPWIAWVNSDQAVVLGTAHRRNDLMFTKEEAPKPQLEIYAFGQGHAISNGREIHNWDGILPCNLFFYFIDNPLVTRDQIFSIFWPDLPIREAANVFHVTKRKISERIAVYSDAGRTKYDLTAYSTGFYVPSGKIVRHYDVADFEQAIEAALLSEDPHEKEMLFSHAIEIYKAPFLHPMQLRWVEVRRKQLREMYAEALIGMGRLKAAAAQWEAALGFYARSLRETPQREDIHHAVMQIYLRLNRPQDARQQFGVLERYLKRTLNIEPRAETRALLPAD